MRDLLERQRNRLLDLLRRFHRGQDPQAGTGPRSRQGRRIRGKEGGRGREEGRRRIRGKEGGRGREEGRRGQGRGRTKDSFLRGCQRVRRAIRLVPGRRVLRKHRGIIQVRTMDM